VIKVEIPFFLWPCYGGMNVCVDALGAMKFA